MVVDVDAAGAAAEDANVGGGLAGDHVARGVAVHVDAAGLAHEAADMDLIVVGGVAGDIAQGIAVDGGDPVVHAVEAAGVDVVGICLGGDVHIRPAVGDGAPQHAGGQAAGPGEAL